MAQLKVGDRVFNKFQRVSGTVVEVYEHGYILRVDAGQKLPEGALYFADNDAVHEHLYGRVD